MFAQSCGKLSLQYGASWQRGLRLAKWNLSEVVAFHPFRLSSFPNFRYSPRQKQYAEPSSPCLVFPKCLVLLHGFQGRWVWPIFPRAGSDISHPECRWLSSVLWLGLNWRLFRLWTPDFKISCRLFQVCRPCRGQMCPCLQSLCIFWNISGIRKS